MRKKRTVIPEQDALYYEAIFALFRREKTIKIVSKKPLLLEISGEIWNKSRMADMLVVFAQQKYAEANFPKKEWNWHRFYRMLNQFNDE